MSYARLKAVSEPFNVHLQRARHASSYDEYVAHSDAARRVLRAMLRAGEITSLRFDELLVELTLARVAGYPPDLVEQFRAVLIEEVHTDPYLALTREALRTEVCSRDD